MTTAVRKKLIEVSIPLEAINVEAIRRKQKAPKGFPTALHKYWAQRPIATCRAVLFAQLVDDPSAWPGRYPFPEIAADDEAERRRLHKVIERMLPWDADEGAFDAARWEIARSVSWGLGEEPPPRADRRAILDYLQKRAPPVYDPFSGGGSIPLEAQRLGLRAYGSDLNPLAVLIGKALVEIPPRFAGLPPMNAEAQAELKRGGAWQGKAAQGLAEDVRYYGRWVRDRGERRIGHLHPKAQLQDGSEGIVVAWLWARTVRSPDPSAKGARVPLISSFVLSNKDGKKVWVEPQIDPTAPDGWRFEVRSGALSKADEAKLKEGTIGRSSGGKCILTGTSMPFSYIREQGQSEGLGARLMAIVADGERSRVYLSPTDEHATAAESAKPAWEPEGELPNNPRDFKTPNYGLRTFASLFTPRQLVALTTFSDLVAEVREKALADASSAKLPEDTRRLHEGGAGAIAYADAIATYVAFAVDRMAFYNSSLCGWLPKDNAMGKSMPKQALAMSWDFAEGNALGKSSAGVLTCVRAVADCIESCEAQGAGSVTQASATEVVYTHKPLISTDPPYFDNLSYADLSDFFYVWLRPSMKMIWPLLMRRLLTPKEAEIVANPYRQGGADAANVHFLDGMRKTFRAIQASDVSLPITVYYAYKQSETNDLGTSSAGWDTFLSAIIGEGYVIDATWPLRTESPTRSIAQGSNALASSIVHVCRKRADDAPVVTQAEFVRLLKRELPLAIEAMRAAGVGPVDMEQSVVGPGMGVFSRHAKVLQDDDSAMSVATAHRLINRVWLEMGNELDASFDAETQVALAWYSSYAFDTRSSGELITLTTAKNTSDRALFGSGVFQNLSGRAALVARDKLSPEWSPATDKHLTVWECVQHTAARLNAESGGTEAAARLVAQMGGKSVDARKLAYRLFEIATQKGWSAEALVYNELAEVWPKLEEAASATGEGAGQAAPAQRGLFEGVA